MAREGINKTQRAVSLAALEAFLPHLVRTVHATLHNTNRAHLDITTKSDGSWVTCEDIAVQTAIEALLAEHFPECAVWGEESSEDKAPLTEHLANARPLWMIDPIDGTSNFVKGFPFYATALSLVAEGHIEAAIIYDITRDEACYAVRDAGAYVRTNGDSRHRLDSTKGNAPSAKPMAITDFKRLPPSLQTAFLRTPPYRSHRHLGASSLEWAYLAKGCADMFIHGALHPWDYAPGLLVLQEAGGVARNLQGASLCPITGEARSIMAARSPILFEELTTYMDHHL